MGQAPWKADNIVPQNGKRVLITGANSGIGYQAALAMARHGAHVLLACRNLAKGQDALQRLQTAAPGASAEVTQLDVSSLASVREAAERLLQSGKPLDVLINNAGVMALAQREVTSEGWERQFATNHLGHFALTGLLLPLLETADGGARVVTVSSLAHRNGKMEWDNLQGERRYDAWGAYGASKLANILFARELDRRAKRAGVNLLSVAVHPGISRTSIFENGPGTGGLKPVILRLLAPWMTQDDAQGALPTLYAATEEGLQGGEYLGPDGRGELKGHPVRLTPRPAALDNSTGEELWRRSEALTGVSYL